MKSFVIFPSELNWPPLLRTSVMLDIRSRTGGAKTSLIGQGADRCVEQGAATAAGDRRGVAGGGENLGAPPTSIHLRQAASETTVKRSVLSDYRVVYFATHGLVAGEVKQASETDDGLLKPAQRLPRLPGTVRGGRRRGGAMRVRGYDGTRWPPKR